MANQYEVTMKRVVNDNLPAFSKSMVLNGKHMERLLTHYNLKLTEKSNAMGINSSALYGKSKADEQLKTNASILLRLYSVFEDYIPRIQPPDVRDLIAKIQEVEPEFPDYAIGTLLGLEPTSGYRLIEIGFDDSIQTTRVLAWLIYKLLCDDSSNWSIIKTVVFCEAAARGIDPPESVLKSGGWNRNEPVVPGSVPTAKNADTSGTSGKSTAPGRVSKKPRRITP